jgi:hypothetical protein
VRVDRRDGAGGALEPPLRGFPRGLPAGGKVEGFGGGAVVSGTVGVVFGGGPVGVGTLTIGIGEGDGATGI